MHIPKDWGCGQPMPGQGHWEESIRKPWSTGQQRSSNHRMKEQVLTIGWRKKYFAQSSRNLLCMYHLSLHSSSSQFWRTECNQWIKYRKLRLGYRSNRCLLICLCSSTWHLKGCSVVCIGWQWINLIKISQLVTGFPMTPLFFLLYPSDWVSTLQLWPKSRQAYSMNVHRTVLDAVFWPFSVD